MISFSQISSSRLKDKYVVLDVDGTIVSDGEHALKESIVGAIKEIRTHARKVVLVSNKKSSRIDQMASMCGVDAYRGSSKKPSVRIMSELGFNPGKTVVVGDKVLTDGIFAASVGAEFVHVKRLGCARNFAGWAGEVIDDLVAPHEKFIYAFARILHVMRVRQWVKNILIAAPLFFAGVLFDMTAISAVALTIISFCFLSSSVYILNDLIDREKDKLHSEKRFRPIASGLLKTTHASYLLVGLIGLAAVSSLLVPQIIPYLIVYLVANTLYSCGLKRIPYIEVLLIASLYILRVVVGGVAAGVYVSPWIMAATGTLALMLIIGKRLSEKRRGGPRDVLSTYSREFLTWSFVLTAGASFLIYFLWSVIILTSVLGVLSSTLVGLVLVRSIWLVLKNPDRGESPEALMVSDRVILILVCVWGALVAFLFYTG